MILRRITKHVKDQNWFAVFLDFFIVVAGIWVALMTGQWAEDRQSRADLARAESDLNAEMQLTYYYAYERLAFIPCRAARYQELGDLLLSAGSQWPGAPGAYGDGEQTKYRVFPLVLRSPNRPWVSSVWDAELRKGTFAKMESEKRQALSRFFEEIRYLASLQDDIRRFESRLQTLANPLELTVSERLRYYDVLMEADALSATLEINAEQVINQIETNKLVSFNEREAAEMRKFLAERKAGGRAIYGECVRAVKLPLLNSLPVSGENR